MVIYLDSDWMMIIYLDSDWMMFLYLESDWMMVLYLDSDWLFGVKSSTLERMEGTSSSVSPSSSLPRDRRPEDIYE
jgi:hypothetical protein